MLPLEYERNEAVSIRIFRKIWQTQHTKLSIEMYTYEQKKFVFFLVKLLTIKLIVWHLLRRVKNIQIAFEKIERSNTLVNFEDNDCVYKIKRFRKMLRSILVHNTTHVSSHIPDFISGVSFKHIQQFQQFFNREKNYLVE